jgi:hypothetical protein
VVQAVECLPGKCEALSSNPRITRKKKERKLEGKDNNSSKKGSFLILDLLVV